MGDSKQQIVLEFQQVQDHLRKLTADRDVLKQEFEKLADSSHRLLQQIQQDSSHAGERKLHSFEAEKRRLEDRLEALEEDIKEKNLKIALLDAKAGDYLQQVHETNTSVFQKQLSEDISDLVSTTSGKVEEAGESAGVGGEDLKCCDAPVITHDQESVEIIVESGKSEDVLIDPLEKENDGEIDENALEKMKVECLKVGVNFDEESDDDDICDNSLIRKLVDEAMKELKEEDMKASMTKEESESVFETTKEEIPVQEAPRDEPDLKIQVIVKERCLEEDHIAVPETRSSPEPILKKFIDGDRARTSSYGTMSPAADDDDVSVRTSNGNGSAVRDQISSLSVLVAELRRVKDDMGKCMSVKEQSFIDLEDQLQAANNEVAELKVSMANLSKDLHDKEKSYHHLEEENKKKKMDIEVKMTEIQDVTNKCSMLSEEKTDLLRKMEVLEIMMTEYRTEIEMLIGEKNKMEAQTKELISAKEAASTAQAEIDSRSDIGEKEREIRELRGKLEEMETQTKELRDKLKVTNKQLKVMAREKEHKQKECDVLRRKVETVELKMCQLQGTFDMLVKAVMVERDDLIADLESKTGEMDELHRTLAKLKENHEQELEKVMREKRLIEEELAKFKSGELKPPEALFADRKMLDKILKEKEKVEIEVKQKVQQIETLEIKLKGIQTEMGDFVGYLKDEMARLKEENAKSREEKKNLEKVFASLQSEHNEFLARNEETKKRLVQLEKAYQEKTSTLEEQRQQLERLQQQIQDLHTKNFDIKLQMDSKEKEFREELKAREGTIHLLNVTLTKNQKQSVENYMALQDEMSTLETRLKSSLEETQKQAHDLEEELKLSKDEKKKEVMELQAKLRNLMDEIKEAHSESISMSPDGDVVSSSLAWVPSLPLDTSDASTFHSVEAEDGQKAMDDKADQIEDLRRRVKELEESVKASRKELELKELEIEEYKTGDVSGLKDRIKALTQEIEELKGKTPTGETFKDHAEFEIVIAAKEDKIKQLEAKVSNLETCIGSGVVQQGVNLPKVENGVESHLEQINKLSTDITALKDELERTNDECKSLKRTVSQLEMDKQKLEEEKTKIVSEYEEKLKEANAKLEEASIELEQKKNLVERLELELSSSEGSHVDEVVRLESNHIGRVAEVVLLHRRKLEQLKKTSAEKVHDLHEHIDELYKEKKSLEDKLKRTKADFDGKLTTSEKGILREKEAMQDKIDSLGEKVDKLEKQKIRLEEEKAELINRYEEEQKMSMDMQSQMVSDLEKLVVSLEGDKGHLEKEVQQLKASINLHANLVMDSEKKAAHLEDQVIIVNKEKEILMEEIKKLKEIIGSETVSRIREDHQKSKTIENMKERMKNLQVKLEESQLSLEEQQKIYAHKLSEEKDDHMMQLKALRKELSEEVDVVDQRKQQVSLEYEDKIAMIINEYEDQITALKDQYEAQLVEEKAEFGRCLVSKIDEYESKLSSHVEEMATLETQIDLLQNEIDEKAAIIEELENTLDEMTLMKAALRAQVDDLKHTVKKLSEMDDPSSIDVLHSKYETRLNEVQEHYENQLSYLRSVITPTDVDAQRAGCHSPSQCSEYSIELSCLRPYLQGQSTPIAELMAELRSQSALGSNPEVNALSHGFQLTRSASTARYKEDTRSHTSADGKVGINMNGLSAHLLAKSLSRSRDRCRSNGSISQLLSKSLSRSDQIRLALLEGKIDSNIMSSKSHVLSVSDSGLEELKDVVPCAEPKAPKEELNKKTSLGNGDVKPPKPFLSKSTLAKSIPAKDTSSLSSKTGTKPRFPRSNNSQPQPLPATQTTPDDDPTPATATSSTTTPPSDPDPGDTAPDKYRMKALVSACCVVQ